MTSARWDVAKFERGCFDRIAYIGRYAHFSMAEILSLTRNDADLLQRSITGIVEKEKNG